MSRRDRATVESILLVVVLTGCGQTDSSAPPTAGSPAAAPKAAVSLVSVAQPERTWEQKLGAVFTSVPDDLTVAVARLELPRLEGGHAIWGSTGRDDRGSLWFGVSVHGTKSAYLLQYDPVQDQFTNRGDVVSQLRRCGVYRDGETQMKIHSKLYQADDGFLYFASMDETDEEDDGSRYPTWGGHLWRMNLDTYEWEHLLATKEALIALAGAGRWIYALGYFNHVVYQHDTQTNQVRSREVGSVGGHISRNLIADARGHVYIPLVEDAPPGTPPSADQQPALRTSLVELGTDLEPLHQTPVPHYHATADFESHGIIAFTFLRDQSFVFSTHSGFVYRVRPPPDESAASVEELGWFHPEGEAYAASLFTVDGETLLVGQANKPYQPHQWIVYDLASRSSRLAEVAAGEELLALPKLHQYGTHTRDNAGNCYCVGRIQGESGKDPVILRFTHSDSRPRPASGDPP
ncbi:MAG: hypothetical protein AB7U20_04355 [Planctomycetaceae bacterium]